MYKLILQVSFIVKLAVWKILCFLLLGCCTLLCSRFVETDGKAFDRVRRTEIGKKYFKLTHFEEVRLFSIETALCIWEGKMILNESVRNVVWLCILYMMILRSNLLFGKITNLLNQPWYLFYNSWIPDMLPMCLS